MQSKQTNRAIRSFVKREGKITTGQQNAIAALWPEFGVDFTASELDLAELFGRTAPTILEIGFGNGLSLATMAEANQSQNYFGIEVHRPGVGSLLVQVAQRGLTNIRVSQHDAVEVLSRQISDNCLDRVQIFFPDPWHKKRHHKRRLIQSEFVQLLRQKIKAGGHLHVATDWENYAEHILETLEEAHGFSNYSNRSSAKGEPAQCAGFSEKPKYRPQTKYEARGLRLGHGVWDIIFSKD